MNKKYKLTNETVIVNGTILYRIQATKDFGHVKAGDLGGFIGSEDNLSHYDNCWIHGDSQVFENAQVSENAQIYGYVRVSENAHIFGAARVYEYARVFGNAWVYSKAQVSGHVWLCGNAHIFGHAHVYGNACVSENAWVCGDAWVSGEMCSAHIKVILDSGIWNKVIIINEQYYLVSTTLKKVLM